MPWTGAQCHMTDRSISQTPFVPRFNSSHTSSLLFIVLRFITKLQASLRVPLFPGVSVISYSFCMQPQFFVVFISFPFLSSLSVNLLSSYTQFCFDMSPISLGSFICQLSFRFYVHSIFAIFLVVLFALTIFISLPPFCILCTLSTFPHLFAFFCFFTTVVNKNKKGRDKRSGLMLHAISVSFDIMRP